MDTSHVAIAFVVGYLLGRFVRWRKRNDWKAKPPTPAQLEYARDLRIKVPRNCTRGELSELIDAAKRRRNINIEL